ncbi:MAG: hypothetical protein ACI9G1_001962 [Pirellulaceae bacterium]|jgi:hypothetical protein
MQRFFKTVGFFFALVGSALVGSALAQHPPTIGYVFPSGGKAGETTEVTLGGYDWTPDMQVFVLDPRVKLEIIDVPSPIIVPGPPYWFGKKARRGPFLLPRETKARLTIAKDVPPGIVRWQVANANGASATGILVVGEDREVTEVDEQTTPQELDSLPVIVSGQIKRIEDVDRYRFAVLRTGPVSISLCAREIGSPLNAVLEVYDANRNRIASAADTAGRDTALTFAGEADKKYSVHIYDLDFRGNRAFVYRLRVAAGPRVVAAIPAAGRRGETREVEFVGYGIATGQAKLESVTRQVAFPKDSDRSSFHYQLQTDFGASESFELHLSDLSEIVNSAGEKVNLASPPTAITGILEQQFGEHRYGITAVKGDAFELKLLAAAIGSPLDVSLSVYDATGKQIASNDDVLGSTDAALLFKASADGEYQIGCTDVSGNSGNRAAVYRLLVEPSAPGFSFTAPELLNIPIGGTAKIALKVIRLAGFKDPISVSLKGLPAGVTVPDDLTIPEAKVALSIDLTVSADAAATASLTKIVGEAKVGDETLRFESGQILIATTITPPFSVDAEGQDDVTKWPRGTIFPAPVLIERQEGFNDEIVLEMTSKQGRHRQGIRGPELVVPPSAKRILYPVTLPEWLETTRTSRMVVNGVAKVKDPQGNIRYSVSKQKTRMGFLPTGALLKLAADVAEFSVDAGQPISVPLSISRNSLLVEPARIELMSNGGVSKLFSAEAVTVDSEQTQFSFSIEPAVEVPAGEYELLIRATVMQSGTLPVVAETKVLLLFSSAGE